MSAVQGESQVKKTLIFSYCSLNLFCKISAPFSSVDSM